MNIIQWNIDGFYKRNVDIQRILYEYKPNILCFQETNLKYSQSVHITQYNGYFKNRQNPGRASGGVAIFIKDNIESEEINLNTHLEAIAITAKLHNKICICNIYLPDSTPFTQQDLMLLIAQLPKPYIIVGDFNSRNTLWGCTYTDNRGKTIEQFLDISDLILLNNGTPTRHNPINGNFSAIDLSIATPSITPAIEWDTLTSYSGSDHWPILLTLFNITPQSEPINKWRLKKPNWELFSSLLDHTLQNSELHTIDLSMQNLNQIKMDELILKLSNFITEAATIAIGKSNHPLNRKIVPWWNDECNTAIKKYKKALNRFKKTKLITDHILLKKARAESKYILKKSKTTSWQKFSSSINNYTHSSTLWKKIKAFKGTKYQQIPNTLYYEQDNNQIELSSAYEISHSFAKHFQNNSSNSNFENSFNTYKNTKDEFFNINAFINNNNHDYNLPLTIKEVYTELVNCNSKSSGPDDIPYVFIKNLSEYALNILLTIYNLIWTRGIFPSKWRQALISPILKPGKNKFNINSYRPISLTCTLCKLLEKMINRRLVWYLETTNKFIKHQYGFRRNRSTQDVLATLHTNISEAIKKKQHTILVALDLEKAYDMVWKNRVLDILSSWSIDGNMLQFIHNFLTDRTFQVKVDNVLSDHTATENGLPQGSVISVTLFLVAINDIFNDIQKPIKYTLFADDCNIYCSGTDTKSTVAQLQNAINSLTQWSSKSGFKFSPSKTQCIIFNKKKNNLLHNIHINNIPAAYTNNVCILGMIFDSKFTWTPHLQKLKKSCNNKMKIIKTLSHFTWGAEKNSLILIYKALILSKIDYGSIIYNSAKSNIKQILNPIHNEAIRRAIGAFRTSPIDSILCLSGEPPLQIRRNRNILKYVTKKLRYPHQSTYKLFKFPTQLNNLKEPESIIDTYTRLCKDFNLHHEIKTSTDYTLAPYWIYFPKVHTQLTQFNKNSDHHCSIVSKFNETINSDFLDYILIYTDASKNINGTGCAYSSGSVKKLFKLPTEASIFTAEITAIREAIIYAKSSNLNKVLIISDSLSALSSLLTTNPSHEISQQIINTTATSTNTIEFMWVPSHTGIAGNETVDLLANQAITSTESTVIKSLPYKDLLTIINQISNRQWQSLWDHITNNKLKNIKKTVTKWRSPTNTARIVDTVTTRARIGHTLLTHSHLFKQEEQPTCHQCNVPLTIEHLTLHCPLYTNVQHILNYPTNMEEAFGEANTDAIFIFFNAIKLINQL